MSPFPVAFLLTRWFSLPALLPLLLRLRDTEVSLLAQFKRNQERCPTAGGDEEIRTLDPLLAGQVLSQLSYTPGLAFSRFPHLGP